MSIKRSCSGLIPLLLVVLTLISACGTAPSSGDTITSPLTPSTPTATKTDTKTAPLPTIPPTETSCPAAGTGRAAVRVSNPRGTKANAVYVFNQGTFDSPTGSILRRYDTTTNTKYDIYTFANSNITNAQLSEDGQWLLFTRRANDLKKELFQMVRIDGKGLQTLYCSPLYDQYSSTLLNSIWSFNGGSLVFNEGVGISDSEVKLLEVDSGNVRLLLKKTGPGQLGVFPTAWIDNFDVYMTGFIPNSDAPLSNVYLLKTATTNNQPTSSLPKLTDVSGPCYDYDSNYNRTKLYVSHCQANIGPGSPPTYTGPSYIKSQPATSGPLTPVVNDASKGIVSIRNISPDVLLSIVKNTSKPSDDGIYTINLATSTFTKLTGTDASEWNEFNTFSKAPWSTLSEDRSQYAYVRSNLSANTYHLAIGKVSGGAPITIASYTGAGNVSLIGWSSL